MRVLLLSVLTFTSFFCSAQEKADLFKTTEYDYFYLGVDYSHAKFIGDFESKSMAEIKRRYFEGWNMVVENEREKYDLEGAMRKGRIIYDTEVASAINSNTAVEDMEAGYSEVFSEEDVQAFIQSYDLRHNSGVGFMFVCEYLNKNRVEGCFHFIAINLSSKEIILHERMKGGARGFGIRNYWIRPVYEIIGQIDKNFKKWKREFE